MTPIDPRVFTQHIRAWRLERGLTQRELAFRIGKLTPDISRWETGERYPTVAQLDAIILALDITPAKLLEGPADSELDMLIESVDEDTLRRALAELQLLVKMLKRRLTPDENAAKPET